MNKAPKKKTAKRENDEKKIDIKSVKELSDEELNKVAGGRSDVNGYFCDPGCKWMGNGCFCDDW